MAYLPIPVVVYRGGLRLGDKTSQSPFLPLKSGDGVGRTQSEVRKQRGRWDTTDKQVASMEHGGRYLKRDGALGEAQIPKE